MSSLLAKRGGKARQRRPDARRDRIRWTPLVTTTQFNANGVLRRHGGLPGALIRHQKPELAVAPRCCSPEADTMCECGGLLTAVLGVWRHADLCLSCNGRPGPCDRRHVTCTEPVARECQHRLCSNPVTLADLCAWDRDPRVCDGCCRDLGD